MDWSWRGLRRNYLTTAVLLRSIPIGIVIASGTLATIWTHRLLSNHQQLVVRTYQIIDTTKDVLIGLDDAETGQRGYLLSGDRRYLDPYEKALERLTQLRASLKASLADDTTQSARVAKLDTLIDQKLGELKRSIDQRDTNGFEAARALEIERMEQATMDTIRQVIGDTTEREKTLLAARQSEVDFDETAIRVVAVIVAMSSFMTRSGIELYIARRRKVRLARNPPRDATV